jgi:HEAT repeat protein
MLEQLLQQLKDEDSYVREQAVKALAQIKDERSVEPLVAALKDTDSTVRDYAVLALKMIGGPAVEFLVEALKDKRTEVRIAAAETLEGIWDMHRYNVRPPAMPLKNLVVALKDEDRGVRQSVEYTLETINPHWMKTEGAKEAIPALVEALKDENPRVRAHTADALGLIKDVSALEPLVTALIDRESLVRATAKRALKEIDARWMHSEVVKNSVPVLLAALKDDDPFIRGEVAELLGKIGDVQAIGSLVIAIEDKDYYVRSWAASALGQIGDQQAVIPLVTLATSDKEVAETAIRSLQLILERTAASVLPDDLRAAAGLAQVIGIGTHYPPPEYYLQNVEVEVDCSRVTDIAQQELIRRGLTK